MQLPPLFEWELRRALKVMDVRLVTQERLLFSILGCGIAWVMYVWEGSAAWGHLYSLACLAGLFMLITQVPRALPDLFSEERCNGTLGLVYLAGVQPWELFLAKLPGAVIMAVDRLSMVLFFLSLSAALGGISISLLVASVVGLFSLLAFVLAACVFGSVAGRDKEAAMDVAGNVGGAICLLPLAAHLAVDSDGLLLASPAYAGYLLFTQARDGASVELWVGLLATWLWTIGLLLAAARLLRANWRDNPGSTGLLARCSRAWSHLLAETPALRVARRNSWLAKNPAGWLAVRDQSIVRGVWTEAAGLLVLWLLGWCFWRDIWLHPMMLVCTATLLNLLVDFHARYALVKRLGDDRRSGALEMLLTTPLQPVEILRGHLDAVREMFLPMAWGMVAISAIFACLGFADVAGKGWSAQTVYWATWFVFIGWAANLGRFGRSHAKYLWISLQSGLPRYAVLATGSGLQPLLIFCLQIQVPLMATHSSSERFPTGSGWEMIMVGLLALCLLVRVFRRRYHSRLFDQMVREFREVAQERLREPDDPIFKVWDGVRRLRGRA